MIDSRQAYFINAASTWDKVDPDYTDQVVFKEWVREIYDAKGLWILEIGCGAGRALPFLAEQVDNTSRVVGIDYAQTMLHQARRRVTNHNVGLVAADAARLPFVSGLFDHVVIVNTWPHLSPVTAVLKELLRVLKPKGCCWIEHFSGREQINQRHAQIPALAQDILPPVEAVMEMAIPAGFNILYFNDLPNSYALKMRKPAFALDSLSER